jgi:hypothetical protein
MFKTLYISVNEILSASEHFFFTKDVCLKTFFSEQEHDYLQLNTIPYETFIHNVGIVSSPALMSCVFIQNV